MNIRSRLKKLEIEAIDNSTICACYPQYFETYKADLSEDSDSSVPILMNEAVPDTCPKCGKQTEKHKIIVHFCDQTTPERFPDEWNKNRNK
jgi:hypothetical protein